MTMLNQKSNHFHLSKKRRKIQSFLCGKFMFNALENQGQDKE